MAISMILQSAAHLAHVPPNEIRHLFDAMANIVLLSILILLHYKYIHTYHSRFIPEGVAQVSQIFLRDAHFLPKFVSYEEHCRRDRW
jgi:hypothetical protein